MVSIPELSAATGLGRDTIRWHCEQGRWPAVRVGRGVGVWRLPRQVLEALLKGIDPSTLRSAKNAGA
jgi:hypothetical protein